MSASFDPEDLLKRIDALCAETISPEDHARLEAILADSEEARRIYFDFVDMHLALGHISRDLPLDARCPLLPLETPADTERTPFHRGPYWSYAAVAAGAFAVSLILQFLISTPHETSEVLHPESAGPSATADAPRYVATFGAMSECSWGGAEADRAEGWRLMPGELDLRRGVAEIRFDSGATIVIKGPTRLRVESHDAAALLEGQAVLRGDDVSDGFSLHTPDATLVDIGTEYAVSVASDGASEVHVFDGVVLRHPRNAASSAQELGAGYARRFDGRAATQVPLDADRFVRQVPALQGVEMDPASDLVVADRFEYNLASLPSGRETDAGTGWKTPWRCSKEKPGMLIRAFENVDARRSEIVVGGGALWRHGPGEVGRIAETSLRLDADGVYYISFLFQRGGDAKRKFLQFRMHENVRWDEERMLRMGVGHPDVAFLDLGGETVRTQLPLDANRPYLLVAKIVAGRTRPDQAFLSIYNLDQPIDEDEPSSWTLSTAPVRADGSLDDFWFLFRGEGEQAVDELRVGRTWRSVTAPYRDAAREQE